MLREEFEILFSSPDGITHAITLHNTNILRFIRILIYIYLYIII